MIQIGGVYTTFCQEREHTLAKVCVRNGRCIAILFKSIKVRGRCDSPETLPRKKLLLTPSSFLRQETHQSGQGFVDFRMPDCKAGNGSLTPQDPPEPIYSQHRMAILNVAFLTLPSLTCQSMSFAQDQKGYPQKGYP